MEGSRKPFARSPLYFCTLLIRSALYMENAEPQLGNAQVNLKKPNREIRHYTPKQQRDRHLYRGLAFGTKGPLPWAGGELTLTFSTV